MKRALTLPFLFLLLNNGYSQNNFSKVKQYNQFKNINISADQIEKADFFTVYGADMGLTKDDEMRLDRSTVGFTGYTHTKYKQYFKGVPVYGGTYHLHDKNEFVVSANGFYLSGIEVNTTPTLGTIKAKEIVVNEFAKNHDLLPKHHCCSSETHQIDIDGFEIEDVSTSDIDLYVIDKAFPTHSNEYALAYKITVQSDALNKADYFVDAHSGSVINSFPLIMHQGVPAIGKTKYYGERTITTDSIAPNQYVLRDPTRGNDGITTYNDGFTTFEDADNYWDLDNSHMDEVAIDVHFCTEQFFDLCVNDWNWNGIDGNGMSMNPVVHANNGASYVNAYWDGSNAYFGNGDCHRGPLTTLEVVGHEFAHGITGNTSGLVYREESGAINESMSDILGKALEFEVDPENFNWFIGASFLYNDKVEPFRNMADPNTVNDPAFYKGLFWRDGAGVHTNSAVGNKWFQVLVDGQSGINENGDPYDCEGIGMKKAARIAFVTNTVYLTESSDYNAFYRNSLLAAEELHGAGAVEIDQLKEAWRAVGLPYGDLNADLDLSVVPVNESFIISECIDNDYYSIEFYVVNLSSTDYEPSMGAYVDMPIQNGPDYEYQVDQFIAGGDSLLVIIDDHLVFDETADFVVNLDLIFVDYNANNNSDRIYVSNSLFSIPDLVIRASAIIGDCFSTGSGVSVRLDNEGCSVPPNTDIKMWIEDEQGLLVWERTLNLPDGFNQNNIRLYTANIPAPSGNATSYTAKTETFADANPDNNVMPFSISSNEPVTQEYLNPFSDTEDLGGQTRVFDVFSVFGDEGIYSYQGERMFVSSGINSNLFTPMCTGGPKEIFDQNENSLHSTIELCADVSQIPNPILSFDLVQFQNENIEYWDEVSEFTTMIKLSLTGSDEEVHYITAQDEGLKINHKYMLPDNFVGTIKIDFFNATGTGLTSPNFLEYDINLLDNLRIYSDENVSVDDIASENNLIVFPNPSHDIFRFEHKEEPVRMSILNAQGQLISDIKNGFTELDLSRNPDGYYMAVAEYPNGDVKSEKLIKMSR